LTHCLHDTAGIECGQRVRRDSEQSQRFSHDIGEDGRRNITAVIQVAAGLIDDDNYS
jgi:hypothetical protein